MAGSALPMRTSFSGAPGGQPLEIRRPSVQMQMGPTPSGQWQAPAPQMQYPPPGGQMQYPPPDAYSAPAYGAAPQMGDMRRPSLTHQGMMMPGGFHEHGHVKVFDEQFKDTPAEPDHLKYKPLDYSGPGYEFSSPFAFSQGEAEQAPVAQMQVAIPQMYSSPPPQQPYMQVTEVYSSVQVNGVAQNVHGFQENVTEAHSRPNFGKGGYGQQQWPQYPPMGKGGPPPMQGPPNGGRLEGWLAKRSDGGIASAWNMRWWQLAGGCLAYSRDEKGQEAGRIELTVKTEVKPIADPRASVEGRMMAGKKPHAFELQQGVGLRTYYLDAGSAEKKHLWMSTLTAVVAQMRQQGGGGGFGGPPGGKGGFGGPPSGFGGKGGW